MMMMESRTKAEWVSCGDLDHAIERYIEKREWDGVGILLQRRDLTRQQRNYILDRIFTGSDEGCFVLYILPHCTLQDMNYLVDRCIFRCWWRFLGIWLQRNSFFKELRRHTIRKALKHADESDFLSFILPSCSVSDVYPVQEQCVVKCWWRTLGRLVQNDHLTEQQIKQIVDVKEHRQHIISRADSEDVVSRILPYCDSTDLEPVATKCFHKRWWGALDLLLRRRDVCDAVRRRIIDGVLTHGDEEHFTSYILPHCSEKDIDHAIEQCIVYHQWTFLDMLISRHQLTEQQRQRVTAEIFVHGNEPCFIAHVFPHCGVSDYSHVIAQCIACRWWRALASLLQRQDLSQQQHSCALDGVLRHGDEQSFVTYIVPHCNVSDYDLVLEQSMAHGWRYVLARLLQKPDLSDRQHQRITDGVSGHGDEQFYSTHIVPHGDIDHMIGQCISRCWWRASHCLLERHDLTEQQRRRIMDGMFSHNDELSFSSFILPHCGASDRDDIIEQCITRCWRHALGRLFQTHDLTEQQIKRIAEHTVQRRYILHHVDEENEVWRVLPYCDRADLVCIVGQCFLKCWWHTLGQLLQRHDVCNEPRRRIIWKFFLHGNEEDFCDFILPSCGKSEADYIIDQCITRRWWQALSALLQMIDLTAQQGTYIIDELLTRGNGQLVIDYSLFHCIVTKVDHVNEQYHTRGWWMTLVRLLRRKDLTEQQRRCILDEMFSCLNEKDLISNLADYQLSEPQIVIELCIARGLWEASCSLFSNQALTQQQRTYVIDRVCKCGDEQTFISTIFPCCRDSDLDHVIEQCITRRWWHTLRCLFQQQKQSLLHYLEGALQGCGESGQLRKDVLGCIIGHAMGATFKEQLLQLCRPAEVDFVIAQYIRDWRRPGSGVSTFTDSMSDQQREAAIENARQDLDRTSYPLVIFSRPLDLHTALVHLVVRGLWEAAGQVLYQGVNSAHYIWAIEEASKHADRNDFMQHILPLCSAEQLRGVLVRLVEQGEWQAVTNILHQQVKQTRHQWPRDYIKTTKRAGDQQILAFRMLLHTKKWEVIQMACTSLFLWEQVRREVFTSAVKHRQWELVQRLSDHSLYDDQRLWALEEAYAEKQWMAYLLLADHGLTMIELMRVHQRLVQFADWNIVLHMLERGAELTEMKEYVGGFKERKRGLKWTQTDEEFYARFYQLRDLEDEVKLNKQPIRVCLEQRKWVHVLARLTWKPGKKKIQLALAAAIDSSTWHVVMQLVRLGIDADQRDLLFTQMMAHGQWAVCRVLLEEGICRQLCVEVLPELMAMNQWLLVARVMEYGLDDSTIRHIMQQALDSRQGSVVWMCMCNMSVPLTVEERQEVFEQAVRLEIWQAVRPLVLEKDSIGIQHRDVALLESIEQHQWDVLDSCDKSRADINVQDENSDTPLTRSAMREDWEAVEEVVRRDGDQDIVDYEGYSVLSRAIAAKQWDTVKVLVEFQGDLNVVNLADDNTPLKMLIDARQGEIIDLAVLWSPGLSKGISSRGETTLHAVCASGWPNTMFYLINRGVNPFALTKDGESALLYAVKNKDCSETLVAECLKLGFGTQQPDITDTYHANNPRRYWLFSLNDIVSPLEYACLSNQPLVMQMLYQSGSCSYRELSRLHESFLLETFRADDYRTDEVIVQSGFQSLSFLEKAATTPRSLKSVSRSVI